MLRSNSRTLAAHRSVARGAKANRLPLCLAARRRRAQLQLFSAANCAGSGASIGPSFGWSGYTGPTAVCAIRSAITSGSGYRAAAADLRAVPPASPKLGPGRAVSEKRSASAEDSQAPQLSAQDSVPHVRVRDGPTRSGVLLTSWNPLIAHCGSGSAERLGFLVFLGRQRLLVSSRLGSRPRSERLPARGRALGSKYAA